MFSAKSGTAGSFTVVSLFVENGTAGLWSVTALTVANIFGVGGHIDLNNDLLTANDMYHYNAGIYSVGSLTVSALSAKSGQAGSLTVGVFSAGSYKNSPKFPTTYAISGASCTASSGAGYLASYTVLPDANYSGFIVSAISGTYWNGGLGAGVGVTIIGAALDNGTFIQIRTNEAQNESDSVLLDMNQVIGKCGKRPGRYITQIMFYAMAYDTSSPWAWSNGCVWAYQF